MRNNVLILLALAGFSACKPGGNGTSTGTDSTVNNAFRAYTQHHFTDALLKQSPDYATGVGYHAYDTILHIPGAAQDQSDLAFIHAQLDSLKSYDTSKLDANNITDYYLIKNQLQSNEWNITTEKTSAWDPGTYNVSGTFATILNEHYAPLPARLQSFYVRLANVPAYYAAAKKLVNNPAPELQSLAIDQNLGGLSIFEKDLADSLHASNLPDSVQKNILTRAKAAADAIKDYAAWLKALKPANPRSFRLGKEFYEQKFKYDIQSSFTAEQLYDSAIVRKQYLHGQMAKISRQLWPKYFGNKPMPADTLALIGQMIDTLSTIHVKPEDFQTAIEKEIPQLVAFIKAKNLIYIDSSKPLIVRKEPAYMAGVAGASISAPGPFDKNGNTYYNVGSLSGWPADKAESYLREYNQYILQILCIHEAIPGHYTQLVYSNQSPSIIKALLGNGAMIEGWAVYTEQMMLENGFGNDAPEMWLMWYKWHLRTVCNTILDYSVHVKDMSKEDALHLLTKEAFQQQAEAEGKWKRVSVTSVQLTSYFNGYKEIIELREAYKQKLGKDFDLKAFHEKFLGYGSAPVKYIRAQMLK